MTNILLIYYFCILSIFIPHPIITPKLFFEKKNREKGSKRLDPILCQVNISRIVDHCKILQKGA